MDKQTDSYAAMAKEVTREHRKVKWFQLRRFLKRKAAFLSLVILVLALMSAMFAPWIAPYPDQGKGALNLEQRLEPPSLTHLLGTDVYGRDLLSRVIYGKIYIIFRHLLPNIMMPVIVMILLDLGPAIIAIGLLSFLGIGTQPPMADWGLMVWDGSPNILAEWWISIVPGCAMFIVVITFNIFGDA
ncbi:ABC transporter permease [Desulfobacula sp.]|uniref:ABC transporter permease n=1 Tax=Desulfobacula sp. TaxID=2593537 RepID=UPI0039B9C3FC